MIKFVLVGNKEELPVNYLMSIVDKLSINKELFNSIELYYNQNEVSKFKIETKSNKLYFVETEFHTHNESKQLFFNLSPQKIHNEFDKELHDLKIAIKNAFIRDWKQCIWLQDQQSDQFAQELYLEIHLTENKLREFINIVMIRNFGPDWWPKYTSFKIKSKYQSRAGSYKRIAIGFNNVNDHLFSIDTDDLLEIMCMKTYKFSPPSTINVSNLLEDIVEVGDLSKVASEHTKLVTKLKEYRKVETDLWFNLFGKYFNDNFKSEWDDFSKNRNHIAHNKLIDYSAYKTILNSIEKIKNAIKNAESTYKWHNQPYELNEEEFYNFLEIEEQFTQNYLRSEIERIESETGVNIRNEEEIFGFMEERIYFELVNIKEKFYFRNDLEIEIYDLSKDGNGTLFRVINKVTDEEIRVDYQLMIDDGRGATSTLDLQMYFNNEEVVVNASLEYINGDGQLVDESYYLPTIQDKLSFAGEDNFIENIVGKIEFEFPNLLDELISRDNELSSNKSVICDSECEECGEKTICLDESIAAFGKCVNCGHLNELANCLNCEKPYNSSNEGGSDLCEGCYSRFEAE